MYTYFFKVKVIEKNEKHEDFKTKNALNCDLYLQEQEDGSYKILKSRWDIKS